MKPCGCSGPNACYSCGSCLAHCDCEQFVQCECVRIDVDLDDARNCPAHGPQSAMARQLRKEEAAAEAAFWNSAGIEETF